MEAYGGKPEAGRDAAALRREKSAPVGAAKAATAATAAAKAKAKAKAKVAAAAAAAATGARGAPGGLFRQGGEMPHPVCSC